MCYIICFDPPLPSIILCFINPSDRKHPQILCIVLNAVDIEQIFIFAHREAFYLSCMATFQIIKTKWSDLITQINI